MAVDERSRQGLHRQAAAAFGPEAASTLMELLPPLDAPEAATKQDMARLDRRLDGIDGRVDSTRHELQLVEIRLGARIDVLSERIERVGSEILATVRGEASAQTRTIVLAMAGLFLSLAALLATLGVQGA